MLPLVARIAAGIVATLATLRLGTGLYVWRVTEALERPQYRVVERLAGGVEIRRYEPYLIAETTVVANATTSSGANENTVGSATATGFRACAAYIFGRNRRRTGMRGWFTTTATTTTTPSAQAEKMAMTAPVRTTTTGEIGGAAAEASDTVTTKVSFFLSANYASPRTAPRPLDPAVRVRSVPAHTLAVRTFAGPPPRPARIARERARILAVLRQQDHKQRGWHSSDSSASGTTLVYGYHDPLLTPSFLRRNEVAVVVEGSV